ncbi:hypothetical protein NC651_007978 [Populus alba x Populus x berolinensis]|nr:hypothetical protein NC651_007978 [Populus alba x Populus x berolinensis]
MVGNKITKSAVPLSKPNLQFRSVISPPFQSFLFYLRHASLFFAFRPLQKILSIAPVFSPGREKLPWRLDSSDY